MAPGLGLGSRSKEARRRQPPAKIASGTSGVTKPQAPDWVLERYAFDTTLDGRDSSFIL